VFGAEILQSGQNGVGRRLAKAAKRGRLDVLGERLQLVDVLHFALAFHNALQNLQHALGADTAGGTLAAAFIHGKVQEVAGDVHHAVVFIQHDHTAGAHHGADGYQRVILDGDVQVFGG